MYYKMESNEEIEKEYHIEKLPSLLIFNKGKFLDKVDGYYTLSEKGKFLKEVSKITRK